MQLITNGRLTIFDRDNFIIDKDLPKYKEEKEKEKNKIYSTPAIFSNNVISPRATFDVGDIGVSTSLMFEQSDLSFNVAETVDLPWWKKLFVLFDYERIYKKYGKEMHDEAVRRKKEEAEAEKKRIPVTEFFQKLKTQLNESEIKDYKETIKGFIKEMEKAKKNGQTALFDEMSHHVERMKVEGVLRAKHVKILTEEQMVTLGKNSKRGIKIDWIKNFNRIIPDDVSEKKNEADSWNIYDNYVVVHYDPDDKGSQKTDKEKKEEEEKKRDPILFGVIADSTNLYYIGDWVDEYCDLTLEKAIDIINGKAK